MKAKEAFSCISFVPLLNFPERLLFEYVIQNVPSIWKGRFLFSWYAGGPYVKALLEAHKSRLIRNEQAFYRPFF